MPNVPTSLEDAIAQAQTAWHPDARLARPGACAGRQRRSGGHRHRFEGAGAEAAFDRPLSGKRGPGKHRVRVFKRVAPAKFDKQSCES